MLPLLKDKFYCVCTIVLQKKAKIITKYKEPQGGTSNQDDIKTYCIYEVGGTPTKDRKIYKTHPFTRAKGTIILGKPRTFSRFFTLCSQTPENFDIKCTWANKYRNSHQFLDAFILSKILTSWLLSIDTIQKGTPRLCLFVYRCLPSNYFT